MKRIIEGFKFAWEIILISAGVIGFGEVYLLFGLLFFSKYYLDDFPLEGVLLVCPTGVSPESCVGTWFFVYIFLFPLSFCLVIVGKSLYDIRKRERKQGIYLFRAGLILAGLILIICWLLLFLTFFVLVPICESENSTWREIRSSAVCEG